MRLLPGWILLLPLALSALAAEDAEVFEHGAWAARSCQGLADLEGFTPLAGVKLGRFGGWIDRPSRATGFFHAVNQDGRWWGVDPEGYRYLCIGLNSVRPAPGDGIEDTAGSTVVDPGWAERATTLLRSHGFTMTGCWSNAAAIRGLDPPMPYCLQWNFMSGYRRDRRRRYPGTGTAEAIYPFDPEFAAYCDERASRMQETKDDPWLVGHFSDNELSLHEEGIVARYLSFPVEDPCHRAAAAFRAARAGGPGRDEDRGFLELVVREYYRTVAAAIRKHDPNHMFLGSRFHGRALASPALFAGAGPHADVISVNYYHRWTPENDRIERWAELAGKPILITEWYAKGADTGLPNDGGAGFLVRSQRDRANFYRHFTLTLLRNPACIGWHWFKYRDGRTINAGVVDGAEKPHAALLDAMREINEQAHPLAEWLMNR